MNGRLKKTFLKEMSNSRGGGGVSWEKHRDIDESYKNVFIFW